VGQAAARERPFERTDWSGELARLQSVVRSGRRRLPSTRSMDAFGCIRISSHERFGPRPDHRVPDATGMSILTAGTPDDKLKPTPTTIKPSTREGSTSPSSSANFISNRLLLRRCSCFGFRSRRQSCAPSAALGRTSICSPCAAPQPAQAVGLWGPLPWGGLGASRPYNWRQGCSARRVEFLIVVSVDF